MNRFTINAMMALDVVAEDEMTAWDVIFDALGTDANIRNAACQTAETQEVPYTSLPPSGADRWAPAAKWTRFDEDRGTRKQVWGSQDGSWWWTDGRVMLRCEGLPPADEKWRRLPEESFATAFEHDEPRRETLWTYELQARGLSVRTRGRRAIASPGVAIQSCYYDLVARSVADVAWLVGASVHIPIHALDGEGRLVAVVMPMRPDGMPAVDAVPVAQDADVQSLVGA